MTDEEKCLGCAQAAYEALRVYDTAVGNKPGPSWSEASPEAIKLMLYAVECARKGISPAEQYESEGTPYEKVPMLEQMRNRVCVSNIYIMAEALGLDPIDGQ